MDVGKAALGNLAGVSADRRLGRAIFNVDVTLFTQQKRCDMENGV